jgi:hypothetical protein
MMLFGIAKARSDQIQVAFLGLDADRRFLLEAVEDVYVLLYLGCVNSTERIAIEVGHNLDSVKALHRPCGYVGLAELRLTQCKADLVPNLPRKLP